MENQTTFNLNNAIQRWRENLAQSPALERENLNELESHLRDSITALQTRNLSVEEAFLIATKRIGQSAALEREFGKVNGSAVWFDRFLWMLLGLQVWAVMGSLSSFASNMLTPLGEQLKSFLGFGSQIVVMDSVRFIITLICSPLLISVVLGFVLWRLTRKKKGVAAFVQKAFEPAMDARWRIVRHVCYPALYFRVGFAILVHSNVQQYFKRCSMGHCPAGVRLYFRISDSGGTHSIDRPQTSPRRCGINLIKLKLTFAR